MNRFLVIICLLLLGVGSLSAATNYKGDLNRDGKVDLADMVVLANAINEGKTDKTLHDINASGSVDDADLHALANIILSEKLTEDTGLNVGIGGWEDGGEDFGGSVGAPSREPQTAETQFYIEGPKYDKDKSLTYVDFGIQSPSDNLSAILFNICVPNEVVFDAGKYAMLYSELLPGHAIYGTPVVNKDSEWGKRLRFIVFSPKLEAIGNVSAPIGRLIYTVPQNDVYGSVEFKDCHIISKGSANIQDIPIHNSWIDNWNLKLISSISIEQGTSLEANVGENIWLNSIINPEDATNKNLKWTSSNLEVASLESDEGLYNHVIAHIPGEAVITVSATDGSGVSASCKITVRPNLVSDIGLNYYSLDLTIGTSRQIEAYVYPEEATDKTLRWESSNPSVATVDESGNVTAVSAGEADITASATDGSGISASCHITVRPILVSGITIDPSSFELGIGGTKRLTLHITPDDATDKSVVWSSDNEAVATVDQEGLVTIVSEGSTTIRVRTLDGSELEAACLISGLSGIADIISDEAPIDIYSVNGSLIMKSARPSALTDLPAGLYILRQGGRAYKIVK